MSGNVVINVQISKLSPIEARKNVVARVMNVGGCLCATRTLLCAFDELLL